MGAPPEYAHEVGLGSMIRIWNECIERGSYDLEGWIIQAALKRENAAALVVGAQLAEENGDCLYRIKGTKNRVEYLDRLRKMGQENGPKGGPHGAKGGRPKNPHKGVLETPGRGIGGNPPPAPAPISNTPLTPLKGGDQKPARGEMWEGRKVHREWKAPTPSQAQASLGGRSEWDGYVRAYVDPDKLSPWQRQKNGGAE